MNLFRKLQREYIFRNLLKQKIKGNLAILFIRKLFGAYMSGMHLTYCLMASKLLCFPPSFSQQQTPFEKLFVQLQTKGVSLRISKHPSDHVFISGMLCQKSQLSSYLRHYQLPSNSWRVQSNSPMSGTLLTGCQAVGLCGWQGAVFIPRPEFLLLSHQRSSLVISGCQGFILIQFKGFVWLLSQILRD